MNNGKSVSGMSALKPSLLKFKLAEESPQRAENDYSFKGEEQQLERHTLPSREQTPSKKESLREAIISRVSASKKSKKSKAPQPDNPTQEFVVQEDLKEMVICHQNRQSEGYYSYSDWLYVNQLLFEGNDSAAFTELWKILRIANFGEVAIPTGLVYEVLAILKGKVSAADKEHQLVSVINNFLEVNQMRSNFYTLKELNNYKPLAQIIRSYDKRQSSEDTSCSLTRKPDAMRFENLYQDAKSRSERKTFRCITSQKQQLKECTFAPRVGNYQPQEQYTSRSSHSKRCVSACKYRRKEPEAVLTSVKAKPIDPRVFDTPPVTTIWGVEEHIRRTVGSYKERLRVKRMVEKPVVLKPSS